MNLKKYSIDLSENHSTQCDSSEERDEDYYFAKTNPLKYKTQLCKKFEELGYCNYGQKCKFAHGAKELVHLPAKKHFRQRKCNGFWKNGYCLYGIRCQFGHCHVQSEDITILKAIQAINVKDPTPSKSRLLRMLNN